MTNIPICNNGHIQILRWKGPLQKRLIYLQKLIVEEDQKKEERSDLFSRITAYKQKVKDIEEVKQQGLLSSPVAN